MSDFDTSTLPSLYFAQYTPKFAQGRNLRQFSYFLYKTPRMQEPALTRVPQGRPTALSSPGAASALLWGRSERMKEDRGRVRERGGGAMGELRLWNVGNSTIKYIVSCLGGGSVVWVRCEYSIWTEHKGTLWALDRTRQVGLCEVWEFFLLFSRFSEGETHFGCYGLRNDCWFPLLLLFLSCLWLILFFIRVFSFF